MTYEQFQALQDQRLVIIREAMAQIILCRDASQTDFVLELGCGHGHFLTAFATHHPRSTCIGIDLMGDRIARAQRKAQRAKLGNLHFMQAEASLFLQTTPTALRFAKVFVLFPDPWPKLRHHKHRLIQSDFLCALADKAARNCEFFFRTDHQPYFEAAKSTVSSSLNWILANNPWPFEFATVFQTRAYTHHSFTAKIHARP